MRKSKKARMIATAIALSMVITTIPCSVYAVEKETGYQSSGRELARTMTSR